jgi:type I restriction enzyme S subunit
MNDLRPGWTVAPLDVVAENLDFKRVPINATERAKRIGEVPYYGATGQVGTIDGHIFNEELVLLGEDGAPFLERDKPKAYLIDGPAWVNNHAHVLRGRAVINRYLLHYLNHFNYLGYANGTTRLKLTQAQMNRIPVLVAPLVEQERIVAAVEEQLSRLDAGAAALRRAERNLKRIRDAILQTAVSGQLVAHSNEDADKTLDGIIQDRREAWRAATGKPYREPASPSDFKLTVPPHWQIASLEAITHPVRVICYGILMPKEHVESGVPYVRVKDMKGWVINVGGLRKTSPTIASKYKRASLKPGDLLLAIRGSYGRVAIVPPELDGGNITQDSARIAAHPDIDPRYLLYYLGGSVANRYYDRVARGVAVKGVNIGDLRSMPVPIPPPLEQRAIADEVERQFTLLDETEATVLKGLRHCSSLRSSLLADAFSGQLVQQNPADEPASALLERMKASPTSTRRAVQRGRKTTQHGEKMTYER